MSSPLSPVSVLSDSQTMRNPLFYAAMFSTLPGYFVLADRLAVWTHHEIFLWMPMFLGFVAFPIMDFLFQPLIAKVFALFEQPMLASSDHRIVLFLGVILNTVILLYGFVVIRSYSVSSVGFWGAVASMGALSAAGITWAHELVHKWNRIDQFFGMFQLATVLYMHFRIEHIFSHHKHVAIPLDAATARRGESIYHFVPRAMGGAFVHAWQIESQRLERAGRSIWSVHNSILRYFAIYAVLFSIALYIGGPKGLLYFVSQALMAVVLTEIINYVEHYGLERKLLPDGHYEPVGPQHSWDAIHRFTGALLANIPTHADHHMHSSKPYHLLKDVVEAPHLPAPYPSMVVASLVPPLYRWIIHPLLDQRIAADAQLQSGKGDSPQQEIQEKKQQ